MQYTLIMPNGKIMQFYLQAMAEMYQRLNGGVVVTNDIFESKEVEYAE
jgi:hypothetical protein